jgi:pyrimidine-nucleoside phosphorylase
VNFLHLLEKKRDGYILSPRQFEELVFEYTRGRIPDYQMAAFLMAVYFRGLTPAETRALTLAMRDSGESLRFPRDPRPLVDKHSTGGVGDKVSLPLAPLLACLGLRVPMVSGRGLGITGGTLDKLDSIPGFHTTLSTRRIVETVQRVGCVICGQTERMVPADRGLYALRDVTGTVPSIPLIVASILSKKLAESLNALVLDVKFGAAAFMASRQEARELARAMVTLGNACGVQTCALLSNMDTPLGRAAGNWLEVKEAAACLDGGGPEDLRALVVESAAHLLVQTGKTRSRDNGRARASDCLAGGEPRRKWNEMLKAQGADLRAFERKLKRDNTAPVVAKLKAPRTGYVARCDARIVGELVRDLGGGRLTKDSALNYDVGVDQLRKPGEPVECGAVLARVHAVSAVQAQNALKRLSAAFQISRHKPSLQPLLAGVIRNKA